MTEIGDKERDDPPENRVHGNIFGDGLHNKHVDPNGRRNLPHLHHPYDQDSEPYGIKPEGHDDREKDGYREDDHGHRAHDRAQNQVYENDAEKDDIAVHR